MAQSLPGMTWRRFLVLVRGLGPQSAWVTLLANKAQQPKLITDTEAAEKFMDSVA